MGNTSQLQSRDFAQEATKEHRQLQPLPAKWEEAGVAT